MFNLKNFILFFFFCSLCQSSDYSYKGFLDYSHNNINHIRSITLDPININNTNFSVSKYYMVSTFEDNSRIIVSFRENELSNNKSTDIIGKENYEEAIEKAYQNINLINYPNHEIIISGDRYSSNIALLFATYKLNFLEPHHHKVILFGIPTLSDFSIYDFIRKKVKYKNDIIIFDYYSLNNISYPGLLIQMTPRSYIRDLCKDSFRKYSTTALIASCSLGSLYALNCTNYINVSIPCMIGALYGALQFNSKYIVPYVVPSEESVQESFLRFRESYMIDSEVPMEDLGTLTFVQSLRL